MAERRNRRCQSQCACGRACGLPSTVFHLAGGSSVGLSIAQPFEDFSRTVSSTARLLEWLRGAAPDCRLIVASSAAVYGAKYVGPIPENAAPAPMSPYGEHKLMMEQLCRSYAITFGLRSTVVRLFSVYGPQFAKAIALGHLFAAATGRTDTGSWRNRCRNTRLDRCAGRGSVVGDHRRVTAARNVSRYQWWLGSRHQRRRNC